MKSKRIGNRDLLIVSFALATPVLLFFGFCLFVFYTRIPPKEALLLQNFNEHRAAFEQLRDMLTADTNVNRIGTWGVNLPTPHFSGYPNEQPLPKDRFAKYQTLLTEVGVKAALRSGDNRVEPELTFLMWTWGCAVSPRHYNIGICWLNQEPTNQIPTLDGYRSQSEYPSAYRHIDTNWYFWTDL